MDIVENHDSTPNTTILHACNEFRFSFILRRRNKNSSESVTFREQIPEREQECEDAARMHESERLLW